MNDTPKQEQGPTTIEEAVQQIIALIRMGLYNPPTYWEVHPADHRIMFRQAHLLDPSFLQAAEQPRKGRNPHGLLTYCNTIPKTKIYRTELYLYPVRQGQREARYEKKSLFFRVPDGNYAQVDCLTDYYQEQVRFEATNVNRFAISIAETWSNPDHQDILYQWLVDIVSDYFQVRHYRHFDSNRMSNYQAVQASQVADHPIEAAYNFYHEQAFRAAIANYFWNRRMYASQYPWTVVASVLHFFNQYLPLKRMLDPFSGWGDRLLGALYMGIEYQGFDPNDKLQPGYQQMIQDFAPLERQDKYHIEQMGFEDAVITPESYDIVYSSPPYAGVEIYRPHHPGQSIVKFSDNWLEGFLLPSLTKAWSGLRNNGYLILQINDHRSHCLFVEETLQHLRSLPGAYENGRFYSGVENGYMNHHWVFQKQLVG